MSYEDGSVTGLRIPDIMRYYKDLIIDAQHEVILATNYWEIGRAHV